MDFKKALLYSMGMTPTNTFDTRAKEWDSDPAKVERARVVAEAIRRAIPLPPGMAALEYGCGTGLLGFALQPDFASITLADTSDGMLEVLTAKIADSGVPNMLPLKLDLSTDPLPASRFGVITSLMTLHHIPDTDAVLRSFFALLTSPGWLTISDLEAEDGSFHGPLITDVHLGFERNSLRRKAESAGFTDICFESVFAVKKPGKSYPLFLMIAQKP